MSYLSHICVSSLGEKTHVLLPVKRYIVSQKYLVYNYIKYTNTVSSRDLLIFNDEKGKKEKRLRCMNKAVREKREKRRAS